MKTEENKLSFTIKNELVEIPRTAEVILQHARNANWPSVWISNANLVLDELITNTISYGNLDSSEAAIRIELTVENNQLVIVMEDKGVEFNPFEEAIEPDLEADIGDRLIGGLGVYFVKILASDYSYERTGNTNRIRLVLEAAEE
ncbi:MAG: ATP-binding protein [Gammaproteobacteria bacterium]|nr:ATP-binding protein [Gammaproteobacteria bacterium]MCY4228895.1 ATP-binding protein [Gammaproteobacteria bacterium]